jgi:hypothetical protein
MSEIEVFFGFLKNAKKNKRDVTFGGYQGGYITIYANGFEGNGIVAKIEKGKREKEVWYGFLGLKKKVETSEWISGYFIDVKTEDRYSFYIKPDEEQYEYYNSKLSTAIAELKNKELNKKDREYKKLLKREV